MSATPTPAKKSRFSRKKKNEASGATPADGGEPGRVAQIKTLYTLASKQNPRIPFYLIGAFLLGFVVLLVIGIAVQHPIYLGILGVFLGVILAMLLFGRLAQKAAYGQLEGQPGATSAAMSGLRKGWYYEQEPVAADSGRARKMSEMQNAAMVFRAVGRAGVVLVGEGPRGGATKLLESERKRVARVSGPEVPVHTLRVGEGEDAVAVSKLTATMTKLPKKLTDAEVQAVNKRLRALGGVKPPIPKGMDPRSARADRKSLRGR
ncbi:DUF4191 domain-containing protein [Allobranchiibius sp. CTAmp26]|uniref:DUF4191 domain-containing protein n=1 Tax=Allobranchiibius sp. CTAmp26 TaxID=2815214 RepID=UPI001AA11CD1|nr:DUF4191 domain-containing protein [Allobranchiibius sp. CTAmp26]MBO1755285.1 DUF4191 domain-containing protein [Allobranchiibius sp. CTAmp26]